MREYSTFLPDFLDEDIYIINEYTSIKTSEKHVVSEPTQVYRVSKTEKEEKVSLALQDQNSNEILLIVNSISSEEKIFLEKVLSAVKLTINDCTLLQLSENNSLSNHKLIEQFQSGTTINFGGQNLNFLQSISHYETTYIADKKILQADGLKLIMEDDSKKKQLWKCLKQLFQ